MKKHQSSLRAITSANHTWAYDLTDGLGYANDQVEMISHSGTHLDAPWHYSPEMEKLANLDQLPDPFGFKVACFPVKLTGGSAGWCRAVAILEED